MDTCTVEMTAAEREQFMAFKAEQEKKEAEAKAKSDREAYRSLVDEEIACMMPRLCEVSENIRKAKAEVLEHFRDILEMKDSLLKLTKEDQRSHTFTNSEGTMRITLGRYTTDAYLDTAKDGERIVTEYMNSLIKDEESKSLVSMIMKLLSKDRKGNMKPSSIMQLKSIALEKGDARFIEGVRIIEEAYSPQLTKTFVKAEIKGEEGQWVSVPLGMTESK